MQPVSCDCTSFCGYGGCLSSMCNTAGGHTHRAQILTPGQPTATTHNHVNKQQTNYLSMTLPYTTGFTLFQHLPSQSDCPFQTFPAPV